MMSYVTDGKYEAHKIILYYILDSVYSLFHLMAETIKCIQPKWDVK